VPFHSDKRRWFTGRWTTWRAASARPYARRAPRATPTRAAFNNPFAKPAAPEKGKTVRGTSTVGKNGTRDSKKVEKKVRRSFHFHSIHIGGA